MKDKPVYATIDQVKLVLLKIDPKLAISYASPGVGQRVEELTVTSPSAAGRVLNIYSKAQRPGIFYSAAWIQGRRMVETVSSSPLEEKEWLGNYVPLEESLLTLVKCLKGEMRF